MPRITLDETVVAYTVRESSRAKHPKIDADLDGITVVVPEGRDCDPDRLLKKHADWVLAKREKYLKEREKLPDRTFEHGASFPYLGEGYRIVVEHRRGRAVEDGAIKIPQHRVERSDIAAQIERLYREEARELIHTLLDRYVDQVDGSYGTVYIRDQETRWGSCSGKGNLNFNWRLMLAPLHVLEYVVVHELVHLEHSDHSERFWSRVEELLPEYERGKEWLKQNSHELVFRNKYSV